MTTFGAGPDGTAMREVEPGVFWINLPDFSPDEAEVDRIRTVFSQIEERGNELHTAKAIVVDMRGNNGGNSAWGDAFVEALWGTEFFSNHHRPSSRGVDWRVSDANIQYLDELVPTLRSQGLDDMVETWLLPVINGLKTARDNGEPLFFDESKSDENDTKKPAESPVSAPIYFLTPGSCASSCLDFADLMLSIDGVHHIGFPTYSDTSYLEIRQYELPEKRAVVVLPIKVYRGRPRADSQALIPEITYKGTDWSDEAIEAWFLGLLGELQD